MQVLLHLAELLRGLLKWLCQWVINREQAETQGRVSEERKAAESNLSELKDQLAALRKMSEQADSDLSHLKEQEKNLEREVEAEYIHLRELAERIQS